MKHVPNVTANAVAATTAIIYIACRLLVGLFPDFMFTVGQSWFHGIAFTQKTVEAQGFVLGLISSTVFAWLVGYLFASIYNFFLNK